MMDPNERVIPGLSAGFLYFEAVNRYLFALKHLKKGQLVLDLGCGTGYGCAILFKKGSVIGVDNSEEAISFAQKKFSKYAKFEIGNAENLNFKRESFDLVCAFEVIEHLKNPNKMLEEIVRVLKKQGNLIISTPNRDRVSGKDGKSHSKYHKKEYFLNEFVSLLSNFFNKVEIYGQHKSTKAKKTIASFMKSQKARENLVKKDILGIRKLFPRYLKEKIWRFLGALFGREAQEHLSPVDFPITKKGLSSSDYFVAVCSK